MTVFLLVRHGETDWNIEGRWQGQIDVPLNEKGIEQSRRIAKTFRYKKIDRIYSSDLSRAYDTAQAIERITGIKVEIDARLREIHQGEWQGLLVSEIQERYRHEFEQRIEDPLGVAPPGGETARQVQERVLEFIHEVTAKYPQNTIAVVSHGFTIAVIVANVRMLPIETVWDLIPQNGETIEIVIE